ncbi:hypothetical protein SMACR_08836 [Sordaria macrospora]|uniref:WGS project CABT00000000 data, contig 2.13 n=2 Tax=Sordaria macrospora TaxID=5147 RepID=F7VYN2_SORMK|nr:uncharacterized protein SMAC_08836 [Sordaria macrospora k-hell]KAA8624312.1 hypothetical protein SMACR_08836 [Sordaria macrospora]KAH7631760.1 hypothetical protein B0T09DRAFT_260620 [Sordaria sp. MPI-SDFR-AT-0083]WPJ63070.1 hypothetical protein SMAC4_08836 [Sordaria macrospora]CCC10627.1 unnamed protein product [Sordaria macrospora k-hell]
MDPRFIVTREELYDVQMDLKRLHSIQHQHSERLRLLEKRQADDAALKSVWSSPFPSMLGTTTPQHGPVHLPANDLFDDLDEQGQNLLGRLQLEPEDEPIRRGAASRANSSDGRHSSAGHSVHSVHSNASGRASSLGLDTNFSIGGMEDDSPLDVPEPPPGFFYLGAAPSIIRCCLTDNITNKGLLYAVVCTGSQKSTVDYSVVKDLHLTNQMQRGMDGIYRIDLPVYLTEARVVQSNSRSVSPIHPLPPSITCSFEVTGMDQPETTETKKSIRVFIGNHTLRLHSADLLLSQNSMTLYGTGRDKLSVPFVRPEDDAIFKNLAVTNMAPGNKAKLNAAAPEFVAGDRVAKPSAKCNEEPTPKQNGDTASEGAVLSPVRSPQPLKTTSEATSAASEGGGEYEKEQPQQQQQQQQPPPPPPPVPADSVVSEDVPKNGAKENATPTSMTETVRREPSAAIRTPWRQTAASLADKESTPLSGYQPAARGRSMKILRPTKISSISSISSTVGPNSPSTTRSTGAFESPSVPRSNGTDLRRTKGSTASAAAAEGSQSTTNSPTVGSWGPSKRSLSTSASASNLGNLEGGKGIETREQRSSSLATTVGSPMHQDGLKTPTAPRLATNPLGSASAFAWMGSKTAGKASASPF